MKVLYDIDGTLCKSLFSNKNMTEDEVADLIRETQQTIYWNICNLFINHIEKGDIIYIATGRKESFLKEDTFQLFKIIFDNFGYKVNFKRYIEDTYIMEIYNRFNKFNVKLHFFPNLFDYNKYHFFKTQIADLYSIDIAYDDDLHVSKVLQDIGIDVKIVKEDYIICD